jgi:outer membrane protein OmpA-like peptidoglycan-associated protein
VLFTIGSSNIDLSKYGSTLRKLALFLTQNQSLILKLEGYADSKTGSTPLNNVLSKKRAKSVYDYLISLGVSESQMTYRGAGETLKFSVKANRRTEITILEK